MLWILIPAAVIALLLVLDWLGSSRLKKRLATGGAPPGSFDQTRDLNTNYAMVEVQARGTGRTGGGGFGIGGN